jgi:4-hydroxy-tetrahydrodipicolinate reductase
MQWCVKNKKPLVTGTTGLNKKEIILLKKGSKNIPIFWSPNMSLGVNIFFQVAEILAQKLMPKEILIQEVHHKHKKDKPSGTAERLAEKLKAIKGTKVKKIESKRVGEVFGIHRVIFKTSGDQLTLEHNAKDRRIFAQGALEAAQWIQNKKTGLYNSEDFLKRKSL